MKVSHFTGPTGPSCPQPCSGTCSVILGSRSSLPCDDHCSLDVHPVNTTWFKSPGKKFVSTSKRLVFGRTTQSLAGQYLRSQYIQHVGNCVTGVYRLDVMHSFSEFVSTLLLTGILTPRELIIEN